MTGEIKTYLEVSVTVTYETDADEIYIDGVYVNNAEKIASLKRIKANPPLYLCGKENIRDHITSTDLDGLTQEVRYDLNSK